MTATASVRIGGDVRRQEVTAGELLASAGQVVLLALAYGLPPIIFQRFPVLYVHLITEDGIAEWGSFGAWLAAFVVLWVLLLRRPSMRTLGIVGLTAAAFFFAGEEISWGQRIFHLHSPEFFRAHNSQGEINLHNFVASRDYAFANLLIAGWSLCASPLACVSQRVRRLLDVFTVPIVPLYLVPWFAVSLVYLTGIGVGIDIRTSSSLCLSELGEFYLGLSVLLLAVHFACKGALKEAPTTRTLAVGSLAVSLAWAFGLMGAWLAPDLGNLEMRLQRFASVVYPEQGDDRNALVLFDYIERHPAFLDHGTDLYTWLLGTRVEHAALLQRLGRREQAIALLESELQAQEALARKDAKDATLMRSRGSILRLLGREDEAATALHAAIVADEAALAAAPGREAEARIRWSLAKTYAASNQPAEAAREGKLAYDLTPDGALHKVIRNWAAGVLSLEL